jgi:hypothetical protein
MRKYSLIFSTVLFLISVLNACKRGPGDCGDGKLNGKETSLDCGAACKLCPPPIAPDGNYIIGRIADVFFTESKDTNISETSFKLLADDYEMYSTGGFYRKRKVGLNMVTDTNILIGLAQSFKFDTAMIPTAEDFIARIDSGYQTFGGLTLNQGISKNGFFVVYKKQTNDSPVFASYYGPTNQPGSYLKIKTIKKLKNNVYNLIGEYTCTLYTEDRSAKVYIDKGRFNLNFKVK